jgi:hypothetical protein
MKTEYDTIFHKLIVAPLQGVAGLALRAVNYYIVRGEFDPETPNASGGCQGIYLVFDGGEIEFDWGFEHAFRGGDSGIAFHLAATDHSVRREGIREWTEDDISGLNVIPATHTQFWNGLIGAPVVRFEVLGKRIDAVRSSPQAVRLSFPSVSVVIAIGMTLQGDQPVSVGDGDEVLIFREQEWVALRDHGVKGIDTLICCWEWSL